MVEFVIFCALALAALVVFATLASVIGFVFWLVFLPFRILGWAIKGLVALIALPFLLIAGIVGLAFFGVGAALFFVPFVPFALLVLLAVWLVKRRPHASPAAN